MKITMLVSTTFEGKRLFKGKTYDVNKKTAERWVTNKLAKTVKGKIENEPKASESDDNPELENNDINEKPDEYS